VFRCSSARVGCALMTVPNVAGHEGGEGRAPYPGRAAAMHRATGSYVFNGCRRGLELCQCKHCYRSEAVLAGVEMVVACAACHSIDRQCDSQCTAELWHRKRPPRRNLKRGYRPPGGMRQHQSWSSSDATAELAGCAFAAPTPAPAPPAALAAAAACARARRSVAATASASRSASKPLRSEVYSR